MKTKGNIKMINQLIYSFFFQDVKVGCFRDQKKPYRAIPILIANLRGQIDWYHLEKTVQKCAELARQKNYQVRR